MFLGGGLRDCLWLQGHLDPDTENAGSGSYDGGGGGADGGTILARSRSAKLSAKAGFSLIEKGDLFAERAKGISKASQEFGMPLLFLFFRFFHLRLAGSRCPAYFDMFWLMCGFYAHF